MLNLHETPTRIGYCRHVSTKQSEGPSRAERLTSLIYALSTSQRKWTAERIGDYLNPGGNPEAREKAIERAKDEIRNEFGLRLVTEDYDGVLHYRIDTTDWYLPPISFSAAESALIALAATLWKDSRLQALARSATERLTGAQPSTEDIAPYLGSYLPRLSMDDPNFKACALAVFNRKSVHFTYRDAGGQHSERTVDVWGIGQRYGQWYFTGYDHTRNERRVFRLSRITGSFTLSTLPKGSTYHPRPEGFSMSQVLQDFDLQHHAELATVRIHAEAALPLRARALETTPAEPGTPGDTLVIAYADQEAFATELAGYGPHLSVLGPQALAEQVASLLEQARTRQRQVAERYAGLEVKYQPRRSTGRGTTAQQVMRNIDMIQYVVAQGGATVAELAERYELSPAKVRQELALIMMCGVPGGQHDELINVNDGDLDTDWVSISNAALLAEPQKLAPMEAVAVLGGLNALASIPNFEHRATLDSALAKLNEAVARFEGWNGALGFALNQVREQDADALLARAVREHQVVRIDYYSLSSGSHHERDIEPIRFVEDGQRRYLRAWCRTRKKILTFRLDRILAANTTGEHFTLGRRHEDSGQPQLRYAATEQDPQVELFIDQSRVAQIEAYQPDAWSKKIDGGYLAKVRFSHYSVLAPLVARHGGRIAVVAPAEAVDYVNTWLGAERNTNEDDS